VVDKSSPNLKKPQEFISFEVFFPLLGWAEIRLAERDGEVEKLTEIGVKRKRRTSKTSFRAESLAQCSWFSAWKM